MRSASSAGPFTATSVAATNLSVGWGVIVIFSTWAHLTASAPFRARARGPVSGRLSETAARRRRPSCPGFPLPFGCRRSLLGHPVPAEELGPPCGRLTGPRVRTSTGLPRSARMSCDRGGCPLYPGDGGALPGQVDSLTGACRSTAASRCTPAPASHLSGLRLTRHQRGFTQFTRPTVPLACGRPDGTGRPRAFPRASHPADQEPTTHAEVGTGHRARNLELRAQHHIG